MRVVQLALVHPTTNLLRLQNFAKTRHMEMWMGPWVLAKLEAARGLEPSPGVDAATMEWLYSEWGGIPRWVLEVALARRGAAGAWDAGTT